MSIKRLTGKERRMTYEYETYTVEEFPTEQDALKAWLDDSSIEPVRIEKMPNGWKFLTGDCLASPLKLRSR